MIWPLIARNPAAASAAEQCEIHHRVQPLQGVALGRKFLQPIVNLENPA
jgi:hypothetical protein